MEDRTLAPNAYTYAAAIAACATLNEWANALDLLSRYRASANYLGEFSPRAEPRSRGGERRRVAAHVRVHRAAMQACAQGAARAIIAEITCHHRRDHK